MKHFIFKINDRYEPVYSTSMKQAEKDMGSKCIAAFLTKEDAEFAYINYYKNLNLKERVKL